ncbi:hypothetical protein [Actinocrinis sp.]|uniref:hypothetical protein n=1 Tax=Actinocrinis sp. TaxID=1920516 RepID=UPI002C12CF4F|nr:hypothetical protein [Actinocrinis sp.]HXR71737.1 hypothetical protein [Actinocrinis sp.]
MNSGVDFEVPALLPADDGSADGGSADGSGIGSGWRRLRWLLDGVWVTLPAWVAGHVLVGLISWHMDRQHPLGKLFMWDTPWYRYIAANGYDAKGGFAHFFPFTPMITAAVTTVTRLPVTIALFGVCWVGALVFGALVHRIVIRETGDRTAARRAAWLTQLAPGAYALVMGYTEPLAGVLAAGYFLAIRAYPGRPARTWTAIILGFLSGIARPTGLLLAIPGVVEGVRSARTAPMRTAAVKTAAVKTAAGKSLLSAVAPIAGLVVYLGYSRLRFHSWLLPFTQQTLKTNRERLINSPRISFHDVSRLHHHGHQVADMCLLLIVLAAALIAIVARKLPASYVLWTLPMYGLAITSHNFTSLPRYIGALFPILIAAALVFRRWWQEALLLAASVALLIWTTHTAFAGFLVA